MQAFPNIRNDLHHRSHSRRLLSAPLSPGLGFCIYICRRAGNDGGQHYPAMNVVVYSGGLGICTELPSRWTRSNRQSLFERRIRQGPRVYPFTSN